jgi:hypothetical protein
MSKLMMDNEIRQDDSTYQGNARLKPTGTGENFTEEQFAEMVRCAADPVYFANNYVNIVTIDEGVKQVELRDYQDDIIRCCYDNRYVILLSSRQSGKSTSIWIYFLHHLIFKSEQTIGILGHKEAVAVELLSRLQKAYELLPKWMQQGVVSWNKKSIELENGSRIIAAATSSKTIRGFTFNAVLLDEFAFVGNNIADDFFRSVYPTISAGESSKLFVVSTPNGMNHFYKMWKDAINGRNSFVPIRVDWWDVPGRDEAWKAAVIEDFGIEMFRVEYGNEFLGSAGTLISAEALKRMSYAHPRRVQDDFFDIYIEPIKGHKYVAIADVARGRGLDYSVVVVIDITKLPYVMVSKYRNNQIDHLIFPDVVYNIGRYYNDAAVLIENNDLGETVAAVLYNQLEYPNILYTTQNGSHGQILGYPGRKSRPGVSTSKAVKRIGCATLKTMMHRNQMKVFDFETISEMTTFVQKKNSYEADTGYSDDLVMCLVLFSWMTSQPFFKDISKTDVRDDIKLQEENNEESLVPFGIFPDDASRSDFLVDSDGSVWEIVEDGDSGWFS